MWAGRRAEQPPTMIKFDSTNSNWWPVGRRIHWQWRWAAANPMIMRNATGHSSPLSARRPDKSWARDLGARPAGQRSNGAHLKFPLAGDLLAGSRPSRAPDWGPVLVQDSIICAHLAGKEKLICPLERPLVGAELELEHAQEHEPEPETRVKQGRTGAPKIKEPAPIIAIIWGPQAGPSISVTKGAIYLSKQKRGAHHHWLVQLLFGLSGGRLMKHVRLA